MIGNILQHTIVLPPNVIRYGWKKYKNEYTSIEKSIKKKNLNSPYVHQTGAIVANRNEIHLKDKTLRSLFCPMKTNNFVIINDEKLIFRGRYYYPEIKSNTRESIQKTLENPIKILFDLAERIDNKHNVQIQLAVLDNIKNLLLILLSAYHEIVRTHYRMQEDISESDYLSFRRFLSIIIETYWRKLLDVEALSPRELIQVGASVEVFIKVILSNIDYYQIGSKSYSKIVRRYREGDSPIYQYSLANNILHSYLPNTTLMLGIEYSGIELPFVINAFRKLEDKEPLNFGWVASYSYSKKISRDAFSSFSPFMTKLKNPDIKSVLVLDDSVTTGRTLKRVLHSLPENITEGYLGLLRFKASNRYHHVSKEGHGGVNPEILRRAIIGATANYSNTYTYKTYTDKNGIFDSEKNAIFVLLKDSYK